MLRRREQMSQTRIGGMSMLSSENERRTLLSLFETETMRIHQQQTRTTNPMCARRLGPEPHRPTANEELRLQNRTTYQTSSRRES